MVLQSALLLPIESNRFRHSKNKYIGVKINKTCQKAFLILSTVIWKSINVF